MKIVIEGRARVVGDDVNTDYIISSSRKKETLDPHLLKRHLLAALHQHFAQSLKSGDLLVAGTNCGCGAAMEIAVSVLLAVGIKAVFAKSFARTFYRNAINNGLVPFECDTSRVHEGDRLIVSLAEGVGLARNETTGEQLTGNPFPTILLDILPAGGLVAYFTTPHDFLTSLTLE